MLRMRYGKIIVKRIGGKLTVRAVMAHPDHTEVLTEAWEATSRGGAAGLDLAADMCVQQILRNQQKG